ncbi:MULTISPECIES: hypothetical protein [Vibrio]|uniref:Uncharacterized protein n=1 Tax=Vibrio jasicida TaxID=766224 RepID=A0ABW7JBS6_9VIBR|nr:MULTISPECIES: hypothetical protein [Vibrio]MCF6452981.1 hypothetical protein [Vibrio sp. MMG023]NOJ16735.1 hypothetical protein [Vibrio jasicida]PAW09803.1 hypothetical protein B6K85_14955 [Vibrio sp. V1B]UQA52685.1 hypothetical protein ITG12_23015 [Vibrio sp. ED002]CAH1541502.1 conserved hypothetical protein [Vibrio jasicida]
MKDYDDGGLPLVDEVVTEGRNAYLHNTPFEENPYPIVSLEFMSWWYGWLLEEERQTMAA